MSNLRSLIVAGCSRLTDKSVQTICEASSEVVGRLRELDVSGLCNLSEYSLEQLAYSKGLVGLQEVNIAYCD